MPKSPSKNEEGEDLVQLNTTIRRTVKTQLNDEAWRRRIPLRELVAGILDDWLAQEREKETDAP